MSSLYTLGIKPLVDVGEREELRIITRFFLFYGLSNKVDDSAIFCDK